VKAVRLHAVGDIRVDDNVPEPPEPGPYEAVVAPLWGGLCGTDLKEYVGPGGGFPVNPHPVSGAGMPLIIGHELSARIVALGSRVGEVAPGVSVGDEVAVMPLQYCGHCYQCRRGVFVLCPRKVWTGITSHWGGLGGLALVESYQLTPLDGISSKSAALIEPAAVALNAVMRADVRPGDVVFVAGAGAIGLFAIMSAQLSGAGYVIASESNPHRADIARSLGAEVVAPDVLEERVRELTRDQGGVDVALECASKPAALTTCVAVTRPGGTVGVPAVHPHSADTDIRRVTREQLTVVGSLGYSQEVWERTAALVRAGRMPVDRAVTATIEQDDTVTKGFAALAEQPSKELKVLIRVNA
jgi:(R,R)-butanediol dehydrogenase/meso-butanediol dehydrogenase/diacetyl reductase